MLDLLDPVADHRLVRMISLMDHSPGVGQYADVDFYASCGAAAAWPGSDRARHREIAGTAARLRGPNRRALLERVAARPSRSPATMTRTVEEIAENAADGIRISEFPVTMAAATAAKQAWHAGHRRRAEHRPRRLT